MSADLTGGAPSESEARPRALGDELHMLVVLAGPIAVAQLGIVAMGLVDTAVVGRVSTNELAGVALGRSIAFAAITLSMGVSFAVEPLAAQALGAGQPSRAWSALLGSLRVGTLLCIPAIAASLLITFALAPLGVEAPVISRAQVYMLAQAPAQVFFIAFLAAKSFLQAHHDTAPALWASVVANVLNFVACALLVLGDRALVAIHLPAIGLPRLGALGAGLSTSLASAFMATWVLVSSRRHRAREAVAPIEAKVTLRLGVPVGLQLLAEVGVFSLVAALAGKLGPAVVSAHQIAIGLASFTFMAALGVSGATSVRVGHEIGSGRSPRRAGLLGIALGMSIMSIGAVVFATAPRFLMRAFTSHEDVVAIGVPLLGIAALFQLFDGMQAVAAGALRGAGDVRFPFIANVVAHWFIGLPVALVLGFAMHRGATGLWWGLTAGLVAVAVALASRFAWLSRRPIARV